MIVSSTQNLPTQLRPVASSLKPGRHSQRKLPSAFTQMPLLQTPGWASHSLMSIQPPGPGRKPYRLLHSVANSATKWYTNTIENHVTFFIVIIRRQSQPTFSWGRTSLTRILTPTCSFSTAALHLGDGNGKSGDVTTRIRALIVPSRLEASGVASVLKTIGTIVRRV